MRAAWSKGLSGHDARTNRSYRKVAVTLPTWRQSYKKSSGKPPVCPCCQRPVDEEEFFVDLQTNTVTFRRDVWKCTPQMTEFLYVLYENRPKCVSYLDIGHAIWGHHAPEGETLRRRIAQYATCARRMLEGYGIQIDNTMDRGHRLLLPQRR